VELTRDTFPCATTRTLQAIQLDLVCNSTFRKIGTSNHFLGYGSDVLRAEVTLLNEGTQIRMLCGAGVDLGGIEGCFGAGRS